MGRGRGRGNRHDQKRAAAERSAVEETWRPRLSEDPTLGPLCTQRHVDREAIHRWLPYRQGFSPELVRRFLADSRLPEGPVLDPFLGSGTTTTEAARAGRASAGVDVVESLLHLARAPFLGPVPPWPSGIAFADPATLFSRLEHPLHRAAALVAAGRTVDGEGHRRKDLPEDLGPLVEEAFERLREDLARPIDGPPPALVRGDARRLPFPEAHFAGVLTSPPYLSRYDYSRVNAPMEKLLGGGKKGGRRRQMEAGPRSAHGRGGRVHPAAEEAATRLEEAGRGPQARTVRGHHADLDRVLSELSRVCRDEALVVVVLAGAEVKKVYVPADLIVADLAEDHDFEVVDLIVARRLRPSGKVLGGGGRVAPRETLVHLRRHPRR